MADPVIEGGIRILAQGHASDTDEEVVFANSFIFAMDPPAPVSSSGMSEAGIAVHDFYNDAASILSKVVGFISIKGYDLGEEPPRTPVEFTGLATASSAASLPSEVAMCLSYFHGTVPRPRKRGRIYLGPLRQTVIDTGTAIPRIHATARTAVLDSVDTNLTGLSLVTWGLLSQVDEVIWSIEHGYVDDAFDIQRRRGEDPVTRSTFDV